MSKQNFQDVVQQIVDKDKRYDAESYSFVRESLDFTLKSLKRNGGAARHVTGQELLNGIRDYALSEYGPMSKAVLNEWGITTCADFGEVVFNLVSSGILGKTDTDSPTDFKHGYSFEEAFVKPFEPRREDHPRAVKKPRTVKRTKSSTPKKADSL
jgi:uncharacterized repeat protein (TIGR04138 family)